jgi:hypothetical protein
VMPSFDPKASFIAYNNHRIYNVMGAELRYQVDRIVHNINDC